MKSRLSILVIMVLSLVLVSVDSKVLGQSSSTNYSVEESSFSTGSGEGTSASYSSRGSAGDLGVGNAYSANYGVYAGPISPNEEYLEMYVNAASIDLDTPSGDPGVLSDTETATGTATFYVRAYLNSSYVVTSISQTLTSENNDTIDPITSAATSSTGTEQFGINLVDNSSPDIGANAIPQPDSNYANGQPATGYGTVNNFQYNAGDTIAQNGGYPAWGQTDFTISYIANISGITEAGAYQMRHQLVAMTSF